MGLEFKSSIPTFGWFLTISEHLGVRRVNSNGSLYPILQREANTTVTTFHDQPSYHQSKARLKMEVPYHCWMPRILSLTKNSTIIGKGRKSRRGID